MGAIATFVSEQFARAAMALLPPGRLWRRDPDGWLFKVHLACGDELVRVNDRSKDLIDEADPRTATELLPEYEEMLALPSTGSIDQRRARVVSKELARPRVRPSDWQTVLAPLFGLDAEDVEIIEISRADAITMSDDTQIYRWHAYRDPSLGGTWDIDQAQEQIDAIVHSHTDGFAIESVDFLCDDPYSLCDRDILGA